MEYCFLFKSTTNESTTFVWKTAKSIANVETNWIGVQAFIQAVSQMSVFEQRLSFKM